MDLGPTADRNHTFRRIKEADLEPMSEIFEEQEWQFCRNELRTSFDSFRDSYLVLEVDGRFAGCISVVNIGENHAYVGVFVVAKELRYQGLGKMIWNRALSKVGKRSIILSSPDHQVDMYARRGFKPSTESPEYEVENCKFDTTNADTTAQVDAVNEKDTDEILAYDAMNTIECAERRQYIRNWVTARHTISYVAKKNDEVVGFVVATHDRDNLYRVGPLQANSTGIAKSLLKELMTNLPTDSVFSANFQRKEVEELIAEQEPSPGYYYISTRTDVSLNRPQRLWLVSQPCCYRF